jgi:hypothetical protein
MKNMTLFVWAGVLLLGATTAESGTHGDNHTVYDYCINWAVQTGPTEITVQLQARYCPYCNPNDSNSPGCTPFEHTLPPYGYMGCTQGYPDGRYAAIRIKDSGGNVLAMRKLICNQTNWPLDVVHAENFIFTGVPLHAGDTVVIEADAYCSWCGHWYPDPVTMTVVASDSQTTYTVDTSALVGTTANVSATLADANTGEPLGGKTISFTLNGLPPVSAVTDSNGIAATTLLIPGDMAEGKYNMTTRFAGDSEYWPSSDVDEFEVKAVVPMKVFQVTKAEIAWPGGTFAVAGKFELPDMCSRQDLVCAAILSIQIGGEEQECQVALRSLGQAWTYMGSLLTAQANQGMRIERFDISWSSLKASFQVSGALCLNGIPCDTLPREAIVTLQIPLAKGSCVGANRTVEFKKQGNVWYYGASALCSPPAPAGPTIQPPVVPTPALSSGTAGGPGSLPSWFSSIPSLQTAGTSGATQPAALAQETPAPSQNWVNLVLQFGQSGGAASTSAEQPQCNTEDGNGSLDWLFGPGNPGVSADSSADEPPDLAEEVLPDLQIKKPQWPRL